jgi:hypothetical protein
VLLSTSLYGRERVRRKMLMKANDCYSTGMYPHEILLMGSRYVAKERAASPRKWARWLALRN